jgi:hypothetical protein
MARRESDVKRRKSGFPQFNRNRQKIAERVGAGAKGADAAGL